jgi:hypothetical protein
VSPRISKARARSIFFQGEIRRIGVIQRILWLGERRTELLNQRTLGRSVFKAGALKISPGIFGIRIAAGPSEFAFSHPENIGIKRRHSPAKEKPGSVIENVKRIKFLQELDSARCQS